MPKVVNTYIHDETMNCTHRISFAMHENHSLCCRCGQGTPPRGGTPCPHVLTRPQPVTLPLKTPWQAYPLIRCLLSLAVSAWPFSARPCLALPCPGICTCQHNRLLQSNSTSLPETIASCASSKTQLTTSRGRRAAGAGVERAGGGGGGGGGVGGGGV